MRKLRRIAQMHQIFTTCLLFMLLALTVYSFAQLYVSATVESRAADQYNHLMSNNRITDLDVLIDEVAYYQFGALPPLPGIAPWDHHLGIYPVDWENFPEEMTANLIGYWEGDVPVYDLYIFQDQATREIVFLNSDRTEIYSIPCPYLEYCDPATYALECRPDLYSGKYSKEEIAEYIAHRDPARLGIWITLVPTKDLYAFLYTRAANDSFLQALTGTFSTAAGQRGGMAMMSSGGGSGPLNDLDGDGVPNRDEIVAGTDPELATDFPGISSVDLGSDAPSILVTWSGITNREYSIETTSGGTALLGVQNWSVVSQWLGGVGADITFTQDVSSGNVTVGFYRVHVRETDNDSDGLADWFELENFGSLTSQTASTDADSDGLNNLEELYFGRDPNEDDRMVYHSIFHVVDVATNTPNPGPDETNRTECFDFHGGGRPLSLAVGATNVDWDADDTHPGNDYPTVYGNTFAHSGGIFFNNDQSNLYCGIYGLDRGTDNAFILFIDSGAGGVSNLSHLSGRPYALGEANNLMFSTNFSPNVAILVGDNRVDGSNSIYTAISGNDVGQGVYELTSSSTISDFSGFSRTTGGAPFSQWSLDGNSGDSPNAGVEVALSLAALSVDAGDTIRVAGIFVGGPDASSNRWVVEEAYGETFSGSGFNTVTLGGAKVQLGSASQTLPPNTYPGFTDDDVMLQAFYWNVPREPGDPAWYHVLTGKVATIKSAGFTMMWLPPAYKAANAGWSVGYEPYDHYDLGSWNQGGGTLHDDRIRYGLSNELATLMTTLASTGLVAIEDIVMNHMAGGSGSEYMTFDYAPHHNTFEKSTNDFHASTQGHNDEIFPYHHNEHFGEITNFNVYGVDVDPLSPNMRGGLKTWGQWLADDIGFQAWRFDYTQGIEPWFIWEWLEHPGQRGKFGFMEYWEDADGRQMHEWLYLTGHKAAIYDWNLRDHFLKPMCEDSGTFDMRKLEEPSLLGRAPDYTVVFIDNHDTFRKDDTSKLGVRTNKPMAYAYAFHSQGLPLVFYRDYFDQAYLDDGANLTGTNVSNEINRLLRIRQVAVAGDVETLYSDTNLYVQLRSGSASESASILTINDDPGNTHSHSVQTPWTNTPIIDLVTTNSPHSLTTGADGSASLGAPSQGYRIYAPTNILTEVEQ